MNTLKLNSKLNKLHQLVLYEPINDNIFQLLKNSSLLRSQFNNPSAKKYRNERNQLEAYEKLIKNGNAQIIYNKTKFMTYGRCNPDNALGLFSLRREIRHTLTNNLFIDIDIVNCHPKLLLEIAQKNNIKLEYLNEYVNNRQYYLDLVMNKYNCNKDQAKKLFIRILYFGSFKNWEIDEKIKINDEIDFINNFKSDIQKIGQLILDNNIEIKKEVENRKKLCNDNKYNEKGSVVSYYLQEIECQILEILYLHCVEKGYINNNIGILCADGLMILKENYNNNILNEFNEIIKNKFDFDLQFTTKDLNEGYSIKQLEDTQININDFWNKFKDNSQLCTAKLYYELNQDKYIYCNKIWYEYNDSNILICRNEAPPSLLNDISKTIQELLQTEKNKVNPNMENYKDINKIYTTEYKRAGNSSHIEGVIKYLRPFYNNDDIENLIDNNINLLVFKNKLYDFNDRSFRDIKKNDYVMNNTNYILDEDINDIMQNKIKKLLFSIFENEEHIKYWSLITASSLFTNKFESLYIHCGTGGNGKGLLSTIIEKSLGSYFYAVNNTFLTSIYKGGASNPDLYKCKGKKYVLVSEPNNGEEECKFNIDFIKMITGGDTITTRDLYKSNISYKPHFTINLQCNNKPDLNKMDNGIQRRLKILNYPFNFVEQPNKSHHRLINNNLKNEINEQFYKQFILYLINIIENNYDENNNYKPIEIPNKFKNETEQYLNDNNPVKTFIDEYIDITNNDKDRIKVSDFLNYFINKGFKEMKQTALIEQLKFNDIIIKKYQGIMTVYNVKYRIINNNNNNEYLFNNLDN